MYVSAFLHDKLRQPRAVVVEAMAQGAELRIHGLGNFSGKAFQNILVALQAGQAGRLAPFSAVTPAMKIIDDEVHVCQPGSQR